MSTLVCADHSGFLFSHPCDRLATGQCMTCGKPICVEHTRLTAEGPRCVTCLREEHSQRDDDDESSIRYTGSSSAEAGTRTSSADPSPAHDGDFGGGGATSGWTADQASAAGDDPHFFGTPEEWRGHYDADDRRAFEPAATSDEGDAGVIENDPGGS